MSDGGKGSKPRPFSVPLKEYDSNWDRIFRKEPQEEKPSEEETNKHVSDNH